MGTLLTRGVLPVIVLLVGWLTNPLMVRADWAVGSLRSINDVLGHVRYLAKLAGKEDLVQQLEPIVKPFLERGIDPKRPLGFAVRQFNLENPPVLLFIPVTSERDFVDLLAGFNLVVAEAKEGIRELPLPDGKKLYLRFAHGYAFGAEAVTTLAGTLPNPPVDLPKENLQNLVALTVRVDQIPSASKQFLFGQLDREMSKDLGRQRGESEAQHLGRTTVINLIRAQVRAFLLETQAMSLVANLDEARHKVVLELRVEPVPGSSLSRQVAAWDQSRSLFVTAVKEAAAYLLVNLSLAPELRQNLNAVLDKSFQEELDKLEGVVKKAVAEKVYRTLEPTLKQETLDAAVMLMGPRNQRYALVGALQVRDGKRLEGLLRDLVKEMPEADRQKIALDHQRVGNVSLHRLELPPLDEEGARLFGSNEAYVAILDQAIFVGLGEQGAEAVQAVLIQAGGGSGQPAPVLDLRVAVSRLAWLSKDDAERLAAAAKKAFSGPGEDTVHLELRGGEVLRLRLEASSLLVKLAVMLSPLDEDGR